MSAPASLLDVVRHGVVDLAAVRAPAALIGGLAVGVHVVERATRDADFAVFAATDADAERVTRDLEARGYRMALALEQVDVGRLSTVRRLSPLDGRTMMDILFASSGIEPEIVLDAQAMDVGGGVVCPVARRGHLVALETLSRSEKRPQDDQDLGFLLDGIDPDDLARARVGVRLIGERGFGRGKDLVRELEAQIDRWR